MKRSGVIRKLDDVGRIVIPKEIRNYLKLEEGSPLEIGINDVGEVVLSNLTISYTVVDFFNLIGNSIQEIIHRDIIVTDKENILVCYGKCYEGKIAASIIKIIEDGNIYMGSVGDKTTILPILQNKEIVNQSQIIIPYKVGGMQGAIIALNNEKSVDLNIINNLEFIVKIMEKICR